MACETKTTLVSVDPAASLRLDEFDQDFSRLRTLYDNLKMTRETTFVLELLETGKRVRQGTRTWTKDDLGTIVRWNHMQPLMPKIVREAPDIEVLLAHAFDVQDEENRMEALCRIPGIGPALASVMLTLTFPEKYATGQPRMEWPVSSWFRTAEETVQWRWLHDFGTPTIPENHQNLSQSG